ncbi:MAG: MarR family transcriptional regulator [Henriciella sp.]
MDFELNTEAILALQIDQLMRRFHSDFHPRAVRIDLEKVGPIGGMVLYVISENNPITAQEIASTLGRDKSQISRVVSLLEHKGLIDKSTHSGDARRSQLQLTEKGKLQVAAFNGALVETTRNTLGQLSQGELDQFSKLLAKVLSSDVRPGQD